MSTNLDLNLKLNPSVKSLWVADLRCGYYTQHRGSLAFATLDDDEQWVVRNCCAEGVLAELAAACGIVQRHFEKTTTFMTRGVKYDNNYNTLLLDKWNPEWLWDSFPPGTERPSRIMIPVEAVDQERLHELRREYEDDTWCRDGVPIPALNDLFFLSFEEIADLIEKYL